MIERFSELIKGSGPGKVSRKVSRKVSSFKFPGKFRVLTLSKQSLKTQLSKCYVIVMPVRATRATS